MVHTDTTTYIPDMANGSLAVPVAWTSGTTTGVGINMYAADTTKEAGWGTGATWCDVGDKYAPVPAATTVGHTVTGYHASADTSTWSWRLNVVNSQKTGVYSGSETETATAVFT
jgi:hypothetical protein